VKNIGSLPTGFAVEKVPHLTIYNWDTGVAAYRHAIMEETARTDTSIQYSWMWDRKDVPCGLYVGVVNFTIGDTIRMRRTRTFRGIPRAPSDLVKRPAKFSFSSGVPKCRLGA